nr:RNA polymerase II second largest subunit [Tanacetum cinerariifolium]
MELGECPYDQGGYFIINESEKVLISQEKISTNHVYVLKKRLPNKYAYVGEVHGLRLNHDNERFSSCIHGRKSSVVVQPRSWYIRPIDQGAWCKAHRSVRITVDAPRDRKCNVWSGGSLLAFLLSFQKTWSVTVDFVLGRIEAKAHVNEEICNSDNGLRVSREKTEYLRCDFGIGEITHNEEVDIRIGDKILQPKESFRVEVAELRMLRWTCGKTLLDMIPNGVYRAQLEVESIINKMREVRLRGRPKLRWEDRVKHDMKELLLSEDMTSDRNKWRARIRVSACLFGLVLCGLGFAMFFFAYSVSWPRGLCLFSHCSPCHACGRWGPWAVGNEFFSSYFVLNSIIGCQRRGPTLAGHGEEDYCRTFRTGSKSDRGMNLGRLRIYICTKMKLERSDHVTMRAERRRGREE